MIGWPGRFELIRGEDRPGVLVDGAHNAQALEALVRGLQSDKRTQDKGRSRTLFLCGYQGSRRAFGLPQAPRESNLSLPILSRPSLQLEDLRQTSEKFEVF